MYQSLSRLEPLCIMDLHECARIPSMQRCNLSLSTIPLVNVLYHACNMDLALDYRTHSLVWPGGSYVRQPAQAASLAGGSSVGKFTSAFCSSDLQRRRANFPRGGGERNR
eukprot:TRINITY_DN102698_c0_g1_i1.p2 TRINITY_DN102698_c0_g1~~TRINITY_DN102698_c0_g1_i1.p2  ORF type:complete len:110 (+),score=8.66 TRINITY_DN102698_c0_g1_i1:364-693(+)